MAAEKDPTRTTTKQKAAEAAFRKRWSSAKAAILAYIGGLPRKRKPRTVLNLFQSNAPRPYVFDVAPALLSAAQSTITTIIESSLVGAWLFEDYVGKAYAQGTAQTRAALRPQFDTLGIDRDDVLAKLTTADAFQHRYDLLRARMLEEVKWIAQDQTQLVTKLLARSMAEGKSVTEVGDQIAALFDQKQHVGERLVRTEVTMALKRARLDEGEAQAELHGLEVRFMHVSAFSTTSRYSHMARHGKVFTAEEIREWYSRDGNAINCKCSQIEVILSRSGEPLAKGLLAKAEETKEKYAQRIQEAKDAA